MKLKMVFKKVSLGGIKEKHLSITIAFLNTSCDLLLTRENMADEIYYHKEFHRHLRVSQ